MQFIAPDRLGIYAGFGFEIPFEERLRLIREAGFGSTAIWWEEKNPRIRELRHRAPELIRDAGLGLDNIHAPYYACRELWSDKAADRTQSVDLHRSWLDDCSRHGIPRMVMHVSLGSNTPPAGTSGLDSFQRLVDHAERANVTIALENTRNDSYLDYLFERIESPRLALCFDTSHDHLYNAVRGRLLDRWCLRLAALHLSDTDGKRDRHWIPGEGVVDFGVHQQKWNGTYAGAYMLECVPKDRNEPVPTFLARACQRLEACIGASAIPQP